MLLVLTIAALAIAPPRPASPAGAVLTPAMVPGPIAMQEIR